MGCLVVGIIIFNNRHSSITTRLRTLEGLGMSNTDKDMVKEMFIKSTMDMESMGGGVINRLRGSGKKCW